ncbi:unnamed protein product, partial [Mesorhabditis belari]|uniref:N-alpha-acetyltransferase 40 n=1 Tax=Mesorhabditis belari TaxID=2138241 RepID=A0AAF3F1D3_9BILA
MAPADANSKMVKKASKMKDPIETFKCLPEMEERKTGNGETITFRTAWSTHLDNEMHEWLMDLFNRNMQQLYSQSQWGYDPVSKKNELQATTARFIIAYNSKGDKVGYTHYRFDVDFARPVVYCYEIQVEPTYQMKGVGSLLLHTLENLAKKTSMEHVVATVFAFNEKSLGFFHKNGYTTDDSCPDENQGLDYLILSKRIV